MVSVVDGRREFLRHTVATLAYRGGKVIRDAPEGFATVRACDTCRSAAEILRHIGDLLEWALWLAKGERRWYFKAEIVVGRVGAEQSSKRVEFD